jgi:long-chain acyl-CoA synthetase
MNLAGIIERSGLYFPDRPAISSMGSEMNYRTLNEQANQIATSLIRLGICPGDRVALCAPNSLEWVVFYFGVLKAGAAAVCISSQATPSELKQAVTETKPKCIFASDDKVQQLVDLQQLGFLETVVCTGGDLNYERLCKTGVGTFEAIDRDRSDTAAILFTGGTTGVAKGVTLSHENIYSAIYNVVFNERSNQHDRALCLLPLHHVFAQMHIMNATLLGSGCLEILPYFDIERLLDMTSAGRVTKLYAVPTIYVRLLNLENIQKMLGSVRYCFSAAASIAVELVHQWKEKTNLSIHEAYGMTESASMVTYNHYYRHVIGSVGTPVGTTEVQFRDEEGQPVELGREGEICIRGRNIMSGYFNRPEETRVAFWGDWFRSGDIGFLDPHGYLFIVDRLKDLIITGGENVYPREVEEVLYTLPQVEECAVIGLPDKEWGEKVTAIIVPALGETIDAKLIRSLLKEKISSFKVPKEFRVVDTLPKSSAGKILKRTLRKELKIKRENQ